MHVSIDKAGQDIRLGRNISRDDIGDRPVLDRYLAGKHPFVDDVDNRAADLHLIPDASDISILSLTSAFVYAAAAVFHAAGQAPAPVPHRPGGLTDREIDVLRLLVHGYSKKQIAAELVVSPHTADHHVRHIYDKIGVSTRAAAALFAVQHQLVNSHTE